MDDDQHDERVLAVVWKFAESGLTLNFDKLKFTFEEHIMSDKGMQVTEDKVEAMAAAPKPKTLLKKDVLWVSIVQFQVYPRFSYDHTTVVGLDTRYSQKEVDPRKNKECLTRSNERRLAKHT